MVWELLPACCLARSQAGPGMGSAASPRSLKITLQAVPKPWDVLKSVS